jgi:hypothetical protein
MVESTMTTGTLDAELGKPWVAKKYQRVDPADPPEWIIWGGVHYTQAADKWVSDQIVDGSISDPPVPWKMACHRQPVH